MPGLGVGLGVGLMSRHRLTRITIDSVGDILFSGETASISGTAGAPDGAAVSATINGEAFDTGTVSGGAWTLSAAPTDAMKGNDVTVEVVVGTGRASTTAHVLPSGVVAFFDARLGVDTTTATIPTDVSTWTTKTGVTITDNGDSTYTLVSSSTGDALRRAINTSVELNHPCSASIKVKADSLGWALFLVGGSSSWVNLTTGAEGDSDATTFSVSDAGGGYYQLDVTFDAPTGTGVGIYAVDGNADTTGTAASIGLDLITVKETTVTQTRATDITAQAPVASPPVASQATAASQPGYDGAELTGDGVSDYMTLGAGLGAHTSHSIFAVAQFGLHDGSKYQFIFDNGPTRFYLAKSPTGFLVFFDGLLRGGNAAAGTSLGLFSWLLDGAGGSGVIRKDGTQVDSDSYTARSLNETIALMARNDGGASWLNGSLRALCVYPSVLSAGDLTIVETALAEIRDAA